MGDGGTEEFILKLHMHGKCITLGYMHIQSEFGQLLASSAVIFLSIPPVLSA